MPSYSKALLASACLIALLAITAPYTGAWPFNVLSNMGILMTQDRAKDGAAGNSKAFILNKRKHTLEFRRRSSGVEDVVGLFKYSFGNMLDRETMRLRQEPVAKRDGRSYNISWDSAEIAIRRLFTEDNTKCYRVHFTAKQDLVTPKFCMDLKESGFVFGGGAAFTQRWPVNKQRINLQPYVSNDYIELLGAGRSGLWGSYVERFWLTSKGLAIHVDDASPLHVGQNRDELCFMADFKNSIYESTVQADQLPGLNMTLCHGPDIKTTHRIAYNKFYRRPNGAPDLRMLRDPIWSTWAKYKTFVSQEKVLKYSEDIKKHNLPCSQIEIDDMYTYKYGDMQWDLEKFPDPKAMIKQLHTDDRRVTSWIVPFFNTDTESFKEGDSKDYFIKENGKSAVLTWWQGKGASLDPSNPEAANWFQNNLEKFRQEVGLDSYKFDAGETFFLPLKYEAHRQPKAPMEYTADYARLVSKFGGLIETRVGHGTQDLPIMVRMFDKDSSWSYRNGLKSLIPTALMLGITGYSFVLPDMIGGNAYSEDSFLGAKPEKELFLRWMQLNAFLPSMQFSIAPWDYDDETVENARNMTKLHSEVYFPAMKKAMEDLTNEGSPIMRPLWWYAMESEYAFNDETQFFVGDSLMVAPILEKGAKSRDIFFPAGVWRDGNSGKLIRGPVIEHQYPASKMEIPHFTKVDNFDHFAE